MKPKKSLKKERFQKTIRPLWLYHLRHRKCKSGPPFWPVVTRLRVGFVFFLGAWKSREANGWVKFMVMNPNGIPKFRIVKNIHQL